MRQIPESDRPREKLLRNGVNSLSDFELLEIIIGSGNGKADVSFIARKVQKLLSYEGSRITLELLLKIKGVSSANASKILASLELARRYLVRDSEPLVQMPQIVARLGDIRCKRQEHFVCLTLDGGQRLIAIRTITIGTLTSTIAHPREVFADAIADRAASVIIAHNHPSNDPNPSTKDISLTQQLAAAGQLIGIALQDHIILGPSSYFSFRQHHLL